MLSRAKTWYIDGTFKVVKDPFVQLASIHAFIRKDGNLKQEPLCYMVMSGRKKKDYNAVLRKILELLPERPVVRQIVSDFESALWKSVATVMAGVTQRGCSFHWAQAVWRHLQQDNLQSDYMAIGKVYRFCRKIFALPYLPEDSIVIIFEQLETRAASSPKLVSLME